MQKTQGSARLTREPYCYFSVLPAVAAPNPTGSLAVRHCLLPPTRPLRVCVLAGTADELPCAFLCPGGNRPLVAVEIAIFVFAGAASTCIRLRAGSKRRSHTISHRQIEG